MRGLTPPEEETLIVIQKNMTGHTECCMCERVPTEELTVDDGVFLALHKRGLLRVEACAIFPDQYHCYVTDFGRLALSLANAVRSLEP